MEELFSNCPFITDLDDHQMAMEVTATLTRITNLIVAGHCQEGVQICKTVNIEEKNCPIWGFTVP